MDINNVNETASVIILFCMIVVKNCLTKVRTTLESHLNLILTITNKQKNNMEEEEEENVEEF